MKELIAISAHCPTPEKRQILLELLLKLQDYRKSYDLLIMSHCPIGETFCELVDFVIYDRFNNILEDFDLTNSFEFNHPDFFINSTLIFSKSTHLAVYGMIYNSINFAKFNGYRNLHYVEYDLLPENLKAITDASKILIDYDTVLVRDFEIGWTHGPYWAFRVDNLEIESPMTNEKIINELRESESKHTEHIFSRLVSNNRSVYHYDVSNLVKISGKIDLIDSHNSRGLNWVIPIYNTAADHLELFIYNEHGGNYNIAVSVNDTIRTYSCPPPSSWTMTRLCEMTLPIKIKIYIDDTLTKSIELNETNLELFKSKNFLIQKNQITS